MDVLKNSHVSVTFICQWKHFCCVCCFCSTILKYYTSYYIDAVHMLSHWLSCFLSLHVLSICIVCLNLKCIWPFSATVKRGPRWLPICMTAFLLLVWTDHLKTTLMISVICKIKHIWAMKSMSQIGVNIILVSPLTFANFYILDTV